MNVHDALNAAVAERHAARRVAHELLADAIAGSVAERVAARDTLPAPSGEYVVVRDGFKGCEYVAPGNDDGEVRLVVRVEDAARYTREQANVVVDAMRRTHGTGWRAARPL